MRAFCRLRSLRDRQSLLVLVLRIIDVRPSRQPAFIQCNAVEESFSCLPLGEAHMIGNAIDEIFGLRINVNLKGDVA